MKKFLAKNYLTLIVLFLSAIAFTAAALWLAPPENDNLSSASYEVYEDAIVEEILSDTCEQDPVADNAYRGTQMITAKIISGKLKGKVLMCDNTCGPIYNQPVAVGDKVSLGISVYESGEIRAYVDQYSRTTPLMILIGLFFLVTIAVGGKTGAKSLIGLVITILGLLYILIPGLLRGAPTILTTFLVCTFVAIVSFTILGGINRKTICAMLGTIGGMLTALLFGLLGQHLCRVSGLNAEDAEAILQLRQTGEATIGLRGLLSAGIIISSLGAVMDVAISISSAMTELKAVDSTLTFRKLMKSGMNIGRDMVGTMTNTLILAFFGSSLILVIYIFTLSLDRNYFLNSPFLSMELISALSSSIGVVLSVPLTCAISAAFLGKKEK